MASDIVQIQFEFDLPGKKWLARFSRAYPDLTFKILSMSPADTPTGNTILEVDGHNVRDFLKEFKTSLPDIACSVLHEAQSIMLLNVRSPSAILFKLFMEMDVPIQYPILVKQGRTFIDLAGERNLIDALLVKLERESVVPVIRKIGRFTIKPLLKARQEKILRAALDRKYFEIPRGVELSELAAALGKSPSAISEDLRRIFKRLAENYFFISLK
jgi:predicted DNA binding protein